MDLSNMALKMFGLGGTVAGGDAINNMGSSSDLPGLAQEFAKAHAANLVKQQGSLAPAAPVPYPNMGGLPAPMSPQAPQVASAAPQAPPAPMPQPRPAAAAPGAPLDITSPAQAASMAAPAAPQVAPMGFQWAQAGGNQHQGLIDRVINTFHHLQQGNTGPAQGQPQAPMMQASAAPQGGDSGPGFFQRNAMMMRDPSTGQPIDPTGAAQAGVRGPDLINKMMGYLNNKPFGDTGSNNG